MMCPDVILKCFWVTINIKIDNCESMIIFESDSVFIFYFLQTELMNYSHVTCMILKQNVI